MSRMCTIAIDFGTAYSGYAYSLRVNNQNVLRVKQWERRTGADTAKTPTCILFDENQEFIGFGYKARDSYYEISKNPNTYFYFKDFKMELYNQKITKDLMIKDVNKKSMSAMKVFSAALKFLRDDALETLDKEGQNMARDLVDITWVLTVPAIWDIPARQFMREAALQAGLVSDSNEDTLVIALEPEAASIRCKQLNSGDFMTSDVAINLCPGTQYIVVDCGGGTIDITVHEVLAGGDLKELHKASGNDKGGRTVDRQFTRCLRRFFCDGLWEEYETNHPKEAQQFMEDFIFFRQSDHSHVQLLDEFKGLVQEKVSKNEVLFNEMDGMTIHLNKQANSESYSPKLEITKSKMESFFNETLVHVTDSVREITNKLPDIKYILLVGGLSSNHILRKHVQKEFGDRAKVLCPKNPQEAILMGAVMFGQDQSVIRSRKSAFTYGVQVVQRFDPSKHDAGKAKLLEGIWCKNIFLELVSIDEDVGWDEIRNHTLNPLHECQKRSDFLFYRTERKNVMYVDDWGVEGPVASCAVEMPDTTKGTDREVKLEVYFGATEIKAKATDVETQNTAIVKMDFISK